MVRQSWQETAAGMAEEQTVTRIFGAPTRYVQGPGAIDSLGELTAGLTRRPLLVADADVLTFIQARLVACFGDRPHEILAFRGEVVTCVRCAWAWRRPQGVTLSEIGRAHV